MRPRLTFNYKEKLHLQKDFKRVFKTGRRLAHPAILIYVCRRGDLSDTRRLGLVTGRKIGGAVERNRVKRRLREIFRLNKDRFIPSLDMVCIPKPGICALDYETLRNTVLGLLKNAGVFTQAD
jgi:ribonuclease P protein component